MGAYDLKHSKKTLNAHSEMRNGAPRTPAAFLNHPDHARPAPDSGGHR